MPHVHLVLFLATFLTTAMTSALGAGANLFAHPLSLVRGFPYAVAVMSILFSHEMGHYLFARRHGVDATLPYFLPAPPLIFPFGTFGAVIRLRGVPRDRRVLFDIGAAGPWAGFLVALPVIVIGLYLSEVRPLAASEGGLVLGDSLLFSWLTRLVLGVDGAHATILLHPVALAGWFGLLVTCLNLLPAGQLDGGHVSYAVFGRYHRWVSRGVVVFLLVMGAGGWTGWLVWVVLLLILGLGHPPPRDPVRPLDARRLVMAALTLVMFIVTFMPAPLDFVEPRPLPVFEGRKTLVSTPPPTGRLRLVVPL